MTHARGLGPASSPRESDHRKRSAELAATQAVARLLQDSSLPIAELLDGVALRIRDAMCADDVAVRVAYGSIEKSTPGFTEAGPTCQCGFSTGDDSRGTIVVARWSTPGDAAEELFAPEERAMVESIAAMLRAELERRWLVERMRRRDTEVALALASANIAIWDWSIPDNRVTWSPELQRMFGREIGVVQFKDYRDAVHPADRERFYETIDRLLATPGQVAKIEYRAVRGDGSSLWVEARGSVLRDALGRPERLLGVIADITGRKLMEESVAQLHKMEALGRMAAGAAHDFNNLLTVVVLSTSELEEGLGPDDPRHASIADILDATRSGMLLTRELLTFGRRTEPRPEQVDPVQLIRDSEPVLRRLLGVRARLDLRLREAGRVLGDAAHLDRVLMNLVANARDAMDGHGTVTVETTPEDVSPETARQHTNAKPGPHVVIAVSDTGSGMDELTRARIFEPFFTTKEPGKGTGLGLSVVFGLVQQFRGFVRVESELGRGSQFRVHLPRAV